MVSVVVYLWCVAEVTHNFSYVLDDGNVVLSAVVPELRGREFTFQDHGDTCETNRHRFAVTIPCGKFELCVISAKNPQNNNYLSLINHERGQH